MRRAPLRGNGARRRGHSARRLAGLSRRAGLRDAARGEKALTKLPLAELARLQLELEYELTAEGRFVPFDGGSENSLICVYLAGNEIAAFLRNDVPEALPSSVVLEHFETHVATAPLPGAEGVSEVDGKFVVQGPGDEAVSWAWSVRSSERAAECAVETRPEWRRRGLARRVTAAWVNAQLAAGRVPFYSYRASNTASRALATSLALPHAFSVITFR